MTERDDHSLLREYAETGSEPAFATLVERYLNLVHSAALRRTGNPHAASEVAQAVFILLAHKAGKLGRKTILSGWLYQAAQLTAANYLRGEIRRLRREQEAYVQSNLQEPADDWAWRQLSPQLDEAMARLGERDRNAIVLRFFENKSLADVGTALGASEDAAKMRVNRALEKLRTILNRRGVALTTMIIAGAVSANSVQAAPAGLAKAISAVAIAKGAAAGTSTLTLVKGGLKFMAWSKAKAAATGVIVIACILSATTVAIHRVHASREQNWTMNQLANAGYATPEDALKTMLWAMHEGDLNSFLASSTPKEIASLDGDKRGRTREQVFALSTDSLATVTGVQIVGRRDVSADAVVLYVHLQGEAKTRLLGFRKIGNDWKFDQMIGVRLSPANRGN